MNDEKLASPSMETADESGAGVASGTRAMVSRAMRRSLLPILLIWMPVIMLAFGGSVEASSGSTAADPTATENCRDALGVVITCPACPPTPPSAQVPYCDIDNQPRFEKYPVGGGCKVNTKSDAGADERYEKGCEPYAYGIVPYSVRGLPLRLVSQTSTTITLGWDPPTGADGYRFSRSDQTKRPHTWDGGRSTVVFGKGAVWYRAEVIRVGETGEYRP